MSFAAEYDSECAERTRSSSTSSDRFVDGNLGYDFGRGPDLDTPCPSPKQKAESSSWYGAVWAFIRSSVPTYDGPYALAILWFSIVIVGWVLESMYGGFMVQWKLLTMAISYLGTHTSIMGLSLYHICISVLVFPAIWWAKWINNAKWHYLAPEATVHLIFGKIRGGLDGVKTEPFTGWDLIRKLVPNILYSNFLVLLCAAVPCIAGAAVGSVLACWVGAFFGINYVFSRFYTQYKKLRKYGARIDHTWTQICSALATNWFSIVLAIIAIRVFVWKFVQKREKEELAAEARGGVKTTSLFDVFVMLFDGIAAIGCLVGLVANADKAVETMRRFTGILRCRQVLDDSVNSICEFVNMFGDEPVNQSGKVDCEEKQESPVPSRSDRKLRKREKKLARETEERDRETEERGRTGWTEPPYVLHAFASDAEMRRLTPSSIGGFVRPGQSKFDLQLANSNLPLNEKIAFLRSHDTAVLKSGFDPTDLGLHPVDGSPLNAVSNLQKIKTAFTKAFSDFYCRLKKYKFEIMEVILLFLVIFGVGLFAYYWIYIKKRVLVPDETVDLVLERKKRDLVPESPGHPDDHAVAKVIDNMVARAYSDNPVDASDRKIRRINNYVANKRNRVLKEESSFRSFLATPLVYMGLMDPLMEEVPSVLKDDTTQESIRKYPVITQLGDVKKNSLPPKKKEARSSSVPRPRTISLEKNSCVCGKLKFVDQQMCPKCFSDSDLKKKIDRERSKSPGNTKNNQFHYTSMPESRVRPGTVLSLPLENIASGKLKTDIVSCPMTDVNSTSYWQSVNKLLAESLPVTRKYDNCSVKDCKSQIQSGLGETRCNRCLLLESSLVGDICKFEIVESPTHNRSDELLKPIGGIPMTNSNGLTVLARTPGLKKAVNTAIETCAKAANLFLGSDFQVITEEENEREIERQAMNPNNMPFNVARYRRSVWPVYRDDSVMPCMNATKIGPYWVTVKHERGSMGSQLYLVDATGKKYYFPLEPVWMRDGYDLCAYKLVREPSGCGSIATAKLDTSDYHMLVTNYYDPHSNTLIFYESPTLLTSAGYGNASSGAGVCSSPYISTRTSACVGIHVAGGVGTTKMLPFPQEFLDFVDAPNVSTSPKNS